jgi:rhodanese-related sulfurtransferase
MKRMLAVGAALTLLCAVLALVGCDGDAEETTGGGGQDGGVVAGESTEAGQGGMSGIDIPEATPGSFVDLTPEQAKRLIDTTPNLVIVDVSPAYADGHLPGAVNYYIGDGSLEVAIPTLDKSVPYLVYCHVDSAAIAGAKALVDAGFPTVYRLEGNYSAWVDAGYPVEK